LATALVLIAGSLPATSKATAAKPVVMVMYFDYDGKDDDLAMLRKSMADLLIEGMKDNEGLRVVEREKLQSLLHEIKLGKSRYIDSRTAQKLGKGVNAQFVVTGRYAKMMGRFLITAKIVEIETSLVVGGARARGRPDQFWQLVDDLVSGITRSVAARLPARVKARTVKRKRRWKRPKKFEASTAVRFAKALDAVDRGKKTEALAHYEAVLKRAPGFDLAKHRRDLLKRAM